MENFAIGATRSINGGSSSSSSSNMNTQGSTSINISDTLEAVVTDVVMKKPRRMEKVPLTIREDEKTKGHFDPRVVSLGPYHHGKENLQMAERIKPIVAHSFVSSSDRDMAEFRRKILEIVDDARRYYLEGSTDKYSNEEFAEMMLLDEDVKELRSKNILFSTYNSDEEVVQLLSSITTFCTEDFRIYDEVKWRIQKHYNSKAKTWIAQLIHKYFNNPWAFIAFVATTCLVTLSFLQTYFTIFPRLGK